MRPEAAAGEAVPRMGGGGGIWPSVAGEPARACAVPRRASPAGGLARAGVIGDEAGEVGVAPEVIVTKDLGVRRGQVDRQGRWQEWV